MGKEKRENSKSASYNEAKKDSPWYKNPTMVAISLVLVAGIGYFSYTKFIYYREIFNNPNKGNPNLKETSAVLPASIWRGTTAEAYRLAAMIPEVIDAQYCHCDCSENPRFNHKSLLTCFTVDHGANCDICQRELFLAYKLSRKGVSIGDIKRAIDSEFSKNKIMG